MPCCLSLDASVPNVQVTRLTLMCEQASGPITMDLTGEQWGHPWEEEEEEEDRRRRKGCQAHGPSPRAGDLEVLRGRAFVLKEGVDYRVKVSFKVRRVHDSLRPLAGRRPCLESSPPGVPAALCPCPHILGSLSHGVPAPYGPLFPCVPAPWGP